MRIEVLAVDPGLAACVPPSARAQAALWAPCVTVRRGHWDPPSPGSAAGIGLLVLEGLFVREVRLAGGTSAELLGHGDVLRPWDDDRAGAPVPPQVCWRVLEPGRLALLDRPFTHSVCAFPEVVLELQSRLIRRNRWLACLLALSAVRRLEPRLLALLWHLADRWGSVGPAGVTCDLSLTHRTLGALVGAERPSVSRSMGRLQEAGAISPADGGGWVLHPGGLDMFESPLAVTLGTNEQMEVA